MVVAVMRMMGNMRNVASSVTMGGVMARVLEVTPLAGLPGVQQAGGGGGRTLQREYRELHLVILGRVQRGLLRVGGRTGGGRRGQGRGELRGRGEILGGGALMCGG